MENFPRENSSWLHRNLAGQDYSNWLGAMQSVLCPIAGVVGQFWESQVCQVLQYRQHHNLVPLSNFLYLQISALCEISSTHVRKWAVRPVSQGCSVLLRSETVFVYKKHQPSAQVAEAEGREWARSEKTWDTFRFRKSPNAAPSALTPTVINKRYQDLSPVWHRHSVSPRTQPAPEQLTQRN